MLSTLLDQAELATFRPRGLKPMCWQCAMHSQLLWRTLTLLEDLWSWLFSYGTGRGFDGGMTVLLFCTVLKIDWLRVILFLYGYEYQMC